MSETQITSEFVVGKCYRPNPQLSNNTYIVFATGPYSGVMIHTERDAYDRQLGYHRTGWLPSSFIQCEAPILKKLIHGAVYKYDSDFSYGEIVFKWDEANEKGIVISATKTFATNYPKGGSVSLGTDGIKKCSFMYIPEIEEEVKYNFKIGQLLTDKKIPYLGVVILNRVSQEKIEGVYVKSTNPEMLGTAWICDKIHYEKVLVIEDLEISLKPKLT